MQIQRHRKIETEIQTDTHSEADGVRLQADRQSEIQTDRWID